MCPLFEGCVHIRRDCFVPFLSTVAPLPFHAVGGSMAVVGLQIYQEEERRRGSLGNYLWVYLLIFCTDYAVHPASVQMFHCFYSSSCCFYCDPAAQGLCCTTGRWSLWEPWKHLKHWFMPAGLTELSAQSLNQCQPKWLPRCLSVLLLLFKSVGVYSSTHWWAPCTWARLHPYPTYRASVGMNHAHDQRYACVHTHQKNQILQQKHRLYSKLPQTSGQ